MVSKAISASDEVVLAMVYELQSFLRRNILPFLCRRALNPDIGYMFILIQHSTDLKLLLI